MNDDAHHHKALLATAKIALGLTVLGCGARVEVHEAFSSNDDSGGGTPPTTGAATSSGKGGAETGRGGADGVGGAGGTAQAFCDAASPAATVDLDPAAFGCCVDHLSSQPPAIWQTPTEELIACCHEVVNQIDQQPALASQIDESLVAPVWPQDESISCCEVLGNPCTMPCGCTVWGPPMPFRLAGALRLLDEVA